ncbi:MAG TPA: ATP-binding protein, partial [Euryarchaeota archaeon]|nr:ATP-binding protein [Euryarchaeota archaeon]
MQDVILSPMTGLVSRESELELIKSAFLDACDNRGKIILVSGEAGMGKTSLLKEATTLFDSPEVTTLKGSHIFEGARPLQGLTDALSFASQTPLFLETDVATFKKIFAVDGLGNIIYEVGGEGEKMDSGVLAEVLSAVQSFVSDSFGKKGGKREGLGVLEYGDTTVFLEHGKHVHIAGVVQGACPAEMKDALSRLVSTIDTLFLDDSTLIAANALKEQLNAFSTLRFSVRRDLTDVRYENEWIKIAERAFQTVRVLPGTKVIVLEDIHWSDELTLFVIRYLCRNISNLPILLICSYRPQESSNMDNFAKTMEESGDCVKVELERLKRDSIVEIGRLYGIDLSEEMVINMEKKCGGNAFFITEMVKQMISPKTGEKEQMSERDIPQSVSELVSRRLDILDPQPLSLLEYLSCVQGDFDVGVAKSLATVKDATSVLWELFSSGILIKKDEKISFSHALFQRSIYEQMSKRWRVYHHDNLGHYFENTLSFALDDTVYKLALHFFEGENWEKSHLYNLKAGESAESLFAMEQAIDYYTRAYESSKRLPLEESPSSRLLSLERLGDAQNALGRLEDAARTYNECIDMTTDPLVKARFHRKASKPLINTGKFSEAQKHLEDGMTLIGEGVERGKSLHQLGFLKERMGNYDDALAHQQEALDIMEKSPGVNHRDIASIYNRLGSYNSIKADFARALTDFSKSYEIYLKIGDINGQGSSLNNMAICLKHQGLFDKALEKYQLAADIFEKTGNIFNTGTILNNMASVLFSQSCIRRAGEYYEKSYHLRKRCGDLRGVAMTLNNLGNCAYSLGEFDKSLSYYEQSLEIQNELGDKPGITMIH